MASRKTEPEPFPVLGTPTGYRDSWEADDSAVIQAQIAEYERLLVAAREAAAPHRRGKRVAPGEPRQPTSPDDRIATDP
jgi:hypothetical protein